MRPRLCPAIVICLAVFAVAGCGGSSGAGAKQPRNRGGEGGVESFGSEAAGSERATLLGAFRTYLGAIADRKYAIACSHLTSAARHSLQRIVASSLKGSRCASILPKLLAPSAALIARSQAMGRIARARIGGDRAFVVFHAPGARLYELTMVREGRAWRAAIVLASILVPSAATLGR
jgi:hypothetical protein